MEGVESMEDPAARKAMNQLIRQAMPKVAALVAEQRRRHGDAHVLECQRRGMRGEPGWFFAREGALAVGTPWDDPMLANFAAAHVTSTQAVLVLRDPGESHGT
jgi:hypothetical protein